VDPLFADPTIVVAPDPPRPPADGPADWLRRNLFRSVGDTIVTVVAAVIVGYIVFRLGRFVLVSGRWTIVRRNLALFMVGRYPRDELWRVGTAVCVIAGYGGVLAGYVNRRQVEAGRAPTGMSLARRLADVVVRMWPLLVGVIVLLALTRTAGPSLLALLVVASAVAGRLIGPLLGRRWLVALVLIGIVVPIVLVWLLTRPFGWDEWGGMMLNFFLAAAGIGLSFPLGVLLALGRRAGGSTDSPTAGAVIAVLFAAPVVVILLRRELAVDSVVTWGLVVLLVAFATYGYQLGRRATLPLVRVVSVAYIEFFRGVPLYVLLGLGYLGLRFFLPSGSDPPGLVVRAIIVFTLFTAAYIAEIVRGGLQSLPKGQTEAAQALGLSPVRTTGLIVLPQALRNVIPAIVGQFISLFKDTTLAGAAIGFLELLNVADAATAQEAFQGQRVFAEALTFVMFVFWVGCITMSRESQRLERKLGVGTR